METLTSEELMAICDRHWHPNRGDYAEFVTAYNAIWSRGSEIRDWCRRLLTHPDYEARATGASLLGQLGSRKQLGDAAEAIIEELGAVTRRPMEEDGKEWEAVDAAMRALAEIGHPAGVPHLRAVLFTDDDLLGGDTCGTATEALAQLVGQPFMQSPDPVAAARAWLAAHE